MSALRVIANCMEPVFCINFHGLMLWKKIESWAKFCARNVHFLTIKSLQKIRKMHKIKLNTIHFFKFCHKINGHPYFTFLCETMFGKLMKIAEKKLPKNPWSTSKGYWKPVRTEGTKLGSRWALVLWHPSSIQPGILKALGFGPRRFIKDEMWPPSQESLE